MRHCEMELLTPVKSKPLNSLTQFVRIDYVGERNVCSNFGEIRSRGPYGQTGEILRNNFLVTSYLLICFLGRTWGRDLWMDFDD